MQNIIISALIGFCFALVMLWIKRFFTKEDKEKENLKKETKEKVSKEYCNIVTDNLNEKVEKIDIQTNNCLSELTEKVNDTKLKMNEIKIKFEIVDEDLKEVKQDVKGFGKTMDNKFQCFEKKFFKKFNNGGY